MISILYVKLSSQLHADRGNNLCHFISFKRFPSMLNSSMQCLKMAAIFLTLASIIRFSAPQIEKSEWHNLDQKLKTKLQPFHHHISRANNPHDIGALGDQATVVIRDFLLEHSELFEDEAKETAKFRKHSSKTLNELEDLKKKLRKEAFGNEGNEEKKKKFYECLKALSHLKKAEKKKDDQKTTLHQEKLYQLYQMIEHI